jgi:hypothetical protein
MSYVEGSRRLSTRAISKVEYDTKSFQFCARNWFNFGWNILIYDISLY